MKALRIFLLAVLGVSLMHATTAAAAAYDGGFAHLRTHRSTFAMRIILATLF